MPFRVIRCLSIAAVAVSALRITSTIQTKVKTRFSNINQRPELAGLYTMVWPAIDKLNFWDCNFD